mgnify:CR=1 FL=1
MPMADAVLARARAPTTGRSAPPGRAHAQASGSMRLELGGLEALCDKISCVFVALQGNCHSCKWLTAECHRDLRRRGGMGRTELHMGSLKPPGMA